MMNAREATQQRRTIRAIFLLTESLPSLESGAELLFAVAVDQNVSTVLPHG